MLVLFSCPFTLQMAYTSFSMHCFGMVRSSVTCHGELDMSVRSSGAEQRHFLPV